MFFKTGLSSDIGINVRREIIQIAVLVSFLINSSPPIVLTGKRTTEQAPLLR